MKLQAYQESAARKVLVYGAPKTGKTELVAALSSDFKLWWFDFEDGIKSVLHSPRIKKEWLDNIEYFHIPDTQIFPVGIETTLKIIKGGEQKICHQHGIANCASCLRDGKGYSSIDIAKFTNKDVLVLDSVSQLSNSAMNHIRKALIQKDNHTLS